MHLRDRRVSCARPSTIHMLDRYLRRHLTCCTSRSYAELQNTADQHDKLASLFVFMPTGTARSWRKKHSAENWNTHYSFSSPFHWAEKQSIVLLIITTTIVYSRNDELLTRAWCETKEEKSLTHDADVKPSFRQFVMRSFFTNCLSVHASKASKICNNLQEISTLNGRSSWLNDWLIR